MYTENFNRQQRDVVQEARHETSQDVKKNVLNKYFRELSVILIAVLIVVYFRESYENWKGNSYLMISGFILGIAYIFSIFRR